MTQNTVDEYRRYFAELSGTEHAKNTLIERILSRLETLEEQYDSTKMDYERERQYNRQGQLKEAQMKAELKELQLEPRRDPFVLVLLDGDGMIFEDMLLCRGESGGKEAANDLWTATRDYINQLHPDIPPHFKIVARAYANLKGLGDTCYRSGILRHATHIEDFARGFTGSKQLFDFVDVGSGKDRADEKISEILKLHLNNRSCVQVIFGCSHDNGYARLLEDIPHEYRKKIALLEGVPFERELRILLPDFETTKFHDVFRSTKIIVPNQPIHRSSTNGLSHSPSREPIKAIATEAKAVSVSAGSSSTTSSPQTPAAALVSTPSTWATKLTSASSPSTTSTILIPSKTHSIVPDIPRNRHGQRIDPPITTPDPNEKSRVAKIKMCNVHYLQRACPYGDACTHDHAYKPNKSELDILRYMNRVIPCRNGTSCDEPKCMYGHRCQRVPEGVRKCSFGSACRFSPEMHGIDTRVVKTTVV